jgi:hypothetical protein
MSNPVRTCIGCAKTDDHPRHATFTPDGADVSWHMDCHAIAAGCEICKAQLEGVGGIDANPKGDKLREHLMTTGPGAEQAGWTAPTDQELGVTPAAKSRRG